MKRLIILISLVVILAGIPAVVISDVSPVDGPIPDSEKSTSQTEAGNSSGGGTITITMYAVADE